MESYTKYEVKWAKSHVVYYNGKCRYIFVVALGGKRTKGAFQIVIGITFYTFISIYSYPYTRIPVYPL